MVKSFNQTSTTGYSSFYKYDAAGRLTEVLVQNPGSGTEILLRYQYDQNGNVTRIDDDLAQKYVLYTYDELSQLTKEEYWTIGGQAADTTIQYSYDELGNRTSVNRNGSTTSYSYNTEKNRLTAVGGVSYTYDEAGNLKNDGTRTYSWNEASQLWQVTSGANTYSFTYDALGRRISKNVNGTVEYYHYDGDRVSYVTNSAGAVLHRFTYDQSGRPVFMGANSTLYYYHYNAHGDVIKLTDLAGNVAAEYTYDAWGNITSQTGVLAGANPYRYAGYWYDQETGLYFLNARYYKPDVGRFVAQDSYGGQKKEPLTLNRYAYAGNNPVKYADPSGNWWVLAGALVGAAYGAYQAYSSGGDWGDVAQSAAEWALVGALGGYIAAEAAVATGIAMTYAGLSSGAAVTSAGMAGLGLAAARTSSDSADDWAELSGMLRDAARDKGNFTVGSATPAQADAVGRAWVGEGAKWSSDGRALVSKSGLRQYRPPSFKPDLGKAQANLESRYQPKGDWKNNAHIDVNGPIPPQ